MSEETALSEFGPREHVLQLMGELPALLETTVCDYFADCELSKLEAAAVERHKNQALHDFMTEVMDAEDTNETDYAWLAPVEREPLNHLNLLYDLYAAAT